MPDLQHKNVKIFAIFKQNYTAKLFKMAYFAVLALGET